MREKTKQETKQKIKQKTKRPLVKHSIRMRIAGYTILFIALSLIAVIICNILFMGSYYVTRKTDSLRMARTYLNAITDYSDEEETETILNFCQTNNLSLVVTDEENDEIFTNMGIHQGDRMVGLLFGYNTGIDDRQPAIIEQTDNYCIQKNEDFNRDETYVEIWGVLDTGYSFYIRTPMASIQESVSIANTFFCLVGVLMCVLAGVLVWLFTGRIIKPITELTNLSQKMASLDFQTKYTHGGDDEIGVLGRNFNTMSEELEKAITELKTANLELQKDIQKKEEVDEMRRDFLSNVTHELKTPIALIQGYAEGLQYNINEDEESRNFYCDVIVDEANKMNNMVKKMLTLNQLEFGNDTVELEQFDLQALIQGVVQASSLVISQKEVTVKVHQQTPLYVWGDEFKIEEVLTNYVSNALNHMEGDMILDIRCEEEDGKVKTIVFNTGKNIPENELDKIWIKFYKVDKARTREYGGNGIGLSIVKAIMTSHKQECGVENYSNGVAFWFTLDSADNTE